MFSDKWISRFLNMADNVSSWSKDPSTKVGAVIVDDRKRIISVGYNGFPRGINDSTERYNDRPLKYSFVSHAERNALDNADVPLKDTTMFVTLMPCSDCAKGIIQRGIKTVVVATPPEKFSNYDWDTDVYKWKITKLLFQEAGVTVVRQKDIHV